MPARMTAQEFLLKQEQETKVAVDQPLWQSHPFSWFILLIAMAMWFLRDKGARVATKEDV